MVKFPKTLRTPLSRPPSTRQAPMEAHLDLAADPVVHHT
eukprot:SAG25_NODE_12258_length_284_cov_0.340541_1_plen_38_part_10